MNKIHILILFIFLFINLQGQNVLINKQKLNTFINTVQHMQSQKQLQGNIIVRQQQQIFLLNRNINLLHNQIKTDSLYIQVLNQQLKESKKKKWYQSATFGYICGTLVSILIVGLLK